MDCEETKELLPWLLNGTLEGPELELVRGHLESCDQCRRELQDTHAAAQLFNQHIPTAALVDHVLGRGTAGLSGERIARHLEACPACRAERGLIEESRDLLGIAAGDGQVVRLPARIPRWVRLAAAALVVIAVSAGWTWTWLQLRAERILAAELGQQLTVAEEQGSEMADRRLGIRVSELERAVSDIGEQNSDLTKQLGSAQDLVGELSRRLEQIRLPQLNVPVIDLFPSSLTLRGDEEVVTVSRQSEVAMLVLSTRIREPGQDLVIRLVGEDGTVQWQRGGLQLSANRDFSLHLPTGLFPAGRYQLLIVDERADSDPQVLESYSFVLE